MSSGTRVPTWNERENNKRRERRRRAVTAKIFAGLRMYGNYKLPKHCDNNEVLKALCDEAGWTVEPDGTTYRKGCKPAEHPDAGGPSVSASPCTSYQPSPSASYNPSPASSTLASPASSSFINNAMGATNESEANSLIPCLKGLSTASSSSASLKIPSQQHFYFAGGSISAPVTPPSSSPTAQTPRIKKTGWDYSNSQPPWVGTNYSFIPSSTPPSPGRRAIPDPAWLAALNLPSGGPASPTFSLVNSNSFDFCKNTSTSGSRMWTPGQSGTCSPVPAGHNYIDVQMSEVVSEEFAFGSSTNGDSTTRGMVKPWEGETIHEECGSDELELTLGRSRKRSIAP